MKGAVIRQGSRAEGGIFANNSAGSRVDFRLPFVNLPGE
jgi:hypothetical protein